ALGIPANAYNGWAVWILPFIEQENIAKTYNPKLHFGHASNREAIKAHVKVFYCPSAPNQPRTAPQFTHSAGGVTYTIADAACADYAVIRNVDLGLVSAFPNDVDPYN